MHHPNQARYVRFCKKVRATRLRWATLPRRELVSSPTTRRLRSRALKILSSILKESILIWMLSKSSSYSETRSLLFRPGHSRLLITKSKKHSKDLEVSLIKINRMFKTSIMIRICGVASQVRMRQCDKFKIAIQIYLISIWWIMKRLVTRSTTTLNQIKHLIICSQIRRLISWM